MNSTQPEVWLRLGSHAEKEYIEKTLKRFDGLIVGANLLEATPGATASLIVKHCGKSSGVPYVIDPMTYAFGAYVDPTSGKNRTDLDWIKSDQRVKGKKGKTIRAIKSSYQKLADTLGTVFPTACSNGRAVQPDDLASAGTRTSVCDSILEYQLNRIIRVFAEDPEYKDVADRVPPPAMLLAPYFYIEPSQKKEWANVSWLLLAEAATRAKDMPVYGVLCAPRDALDDELFLDEVLGKLPTTKISGVWLWFSQFDERIASERQLSNLKKLTLALGSKMRVFNLHGGFFSLALSKHGLTGIAHGVGYGEQKDVVPVIGQSTPTVRYYLPALYARFGVPDIERCFTIVGVKTPDDFFAKICDCVVCRGVIASSLGNFREFGERRYSTPLSKRAAQTPAAAKRCRFHFLLCRLKERDWVGAKTNDEVLNELKKNCQSWRSTVLSEHVQQVALWAKLLANK